MAFFQIKCPEQLDFRNPGKWEQWLKRFERFRVSSKLVAEEGEYQVNTLLYTMGSEADEILTSFGLTAEESKSYNTVIRKFNSFFVIKRNVIFERAKFNSRKQEAGESVESFITALYALVEHCAYQVLKDEMIRDRIVVGLRDSRLSLKLQLDPNLTLDSAITQARQSENVQKQQDVMRNNFTTGAKVESVKSKRQNKAKPGQSQKGKGKPRKETSSDSCSRCGGGAHAKQKCPARESKCNTCKKVGHWWKVCRSSSRVHDVTETEDDAAFLGSVTGTLLNNATLDSVGGETSQPWTADIRVADSDTPVKFKIDSGADVTLLPMTSFKEVAKKRHISLNSPDRHLSGVGEYKLKVCGQFTTELKWEEKSVQQKVYVVEDSEIMVPLLGRPAIEALEILTKDARLDMVSSADQKEIYRKAYPHLFTGLGNTQRTYKIELKPDATPFALSTPRRIALPLTKLVREELNRMVDLGVISPITEPTEWCAGMVVIPKSDNRVRICVDLTKLNETVRRENHPLPSIEETLGQLAGAKYFTKLDANSGFYQVPLAKESSRLTTFITPFGRYCFNRLPFGISSAPEVFQRQMTQILDEVPSVPCQIDDILVSGKTREEHDARLKLVLEKISAAGVTLNLSKCEFAKTTIKFLGFIVDAAGVRPDPEKIRAITEMQEPTSITEVRRFFGMINFLSKFSPNLAEISKPIRDLLKAKSAWYWDQPQQDAFNSMKREISSAQVLAHYDSAKPTTVSADASSYGLGAVLLQQHGDDWKPVAYASRALTPTEQRYAQVEKEALATTWACERFSNYLIGLCFTIETDHKPLLSLLGAKELDLLPIRVQRFRMRLMRFEYKIVYVPGKNLLVADTLSRAPILSNSKLDEELKDETDAYVASVITNMPASERRLDEIRASLQQDEVCRELIRLCQEGWPETTKLPGALKVYFPCRDELSFENGLLLRGSRLVIPLAMRLQMLDIIHTGHQGIVKCRERAKQSIWWPGLSKQLKELVDNCTDCIKERTNTPEPLMSSVLPERPWQKVGTDLFTLKNANYLLVVDYYSRFIEINKLSQTTSDSIINHLKSLFARHGIPEVVMSDNGPQFASSTFQEFADQYRFSHITSSPTFPQSNGEAERAVKTIKAMLKKESDPYMALLAYRSTPLQNGYSPSELLMGRRLRTTVPVLPETLNPKIPDLKSLRYKEDQSRFKQKENFDFRHRAKTLEELEPGRTVWAKDLGKSVVTQKTNFPRSYVVETPNGSYRRNRQQLVPMPATPGSAPPADPPPDEKPPATTPARSATTTVTRSGRQVVPPKRLDL